MEIKHNIRNNYIDTLCSEELTRYNDNQYDDNLLGSRGIVILPISKTAILYTNIQYYLFPRWLSSDPGDDDHFAHFADESHCFYCVMLPCSLCIVKLS